MNIDDVEQIITKAIKHLKPKFKEKISIIEIFDLSQKVLEEIKFEKNLKDESFEFSLSRSDLEKILTDGDLQIEYTDGTQVTFILEEEGLKIMTLENGDVLIWYEGDEK